MLRRDYKLLRFFNPKEAWGNPVAMDFNFLVLLDRIRGEFPKNAYFRIHCAADRDGHTTNSEHYLRPCPCADLHVDNIPFPKAIDQMEAILRKLKVDSFVSLGIYPTWKNPGFHIGYTGKRKRWGFVHGEQLAYDEVKKYTIKNYGSKK